MPGIDDNWTGAEIKACCRLSALLNEPPTHAANKIVPVAVTAADKVTQLREWASGKLPLRLPQPGIYQSKTPTTTTGRRAITKKEIAHV